MQDSLTVFFFSSAFITRGISVLRMVFSNECVDSSTQSLEMHWTNWSKFILPLALNSYLQGVWYEHNVRVLTGYSVAVQTGHNSYSRWVTAAAVGQMITLVIGINPTKLPSTENKLLPQLVQMLDGWWKDDPPPTKILPIKACVPKYLCHFCNAN